jgi:NhaP-type Na+/H+ or K+/H+ antiporter
MTMNWKTKLQLFWMGIRGKAVPLAACGVFLYFAGKWEEDPNYWDGVWAGVVSYWDQDVIVGGLIVVMLVVVGVWIAVRVREAWLRAALRRAEAERDEAWADFQAGICREYIQQHGGAWPDAEFRARMDRQPRLSLRRFLSH